MTVLTWLVFVMAVVYGLSRQRRKHSGHRAFPSFHASVIIHEVDTYVSRTVETVRDIKDPEPTQPDPTMDTHQAFPSEHVHRDYGLGCNHRGYTCCDVCCKEMD